MSQLLTSAGVACTHEGVFNLSGWDVALSNLTLRRKNPQWGWEADASWLATPFLDRSEIDALTVVQLVRHPKLVIDSHLRLMLYCLRLDPFYKWMAEYAPGLAHCHTPENRAALWYVILNEMCEKRTDIRHRIEDSDIDLLDALGIEYAGKMLFDNKKYNSRYGFGPSDVQLDDISQPLRDRLIEMSERYGYEWDQWTPRTVDAVWIGGRTVPIDERAAHIGGSWQIRDAQGRPMAYDLGLLQFFARQVRQIENPVILDIGASTGSFTLLPLVTGGKVIAFEPNPVAFRSLEATIRANNLNGSVELYECAIGNGTRAFLFVPEPAIHMAVATMGQPRRTDLRWNDIEVDQITVDSLNLDRVDFMKIDVEGAEIEVFYSAEQTIKRHKPSILTEYTSLNTRQCGYEREEIMALLKRWGYTKFRQVGIEDLWCQP
jgi:FkbM family methyltransferase